MFSLVPAHHGGMTTRPSDPRSYAVPLADLEGSTHVPRERQVAEVRPGAPSPGPLSPEEFDRQQLLGVTGAGRLHPERI